MNKLDLFLITKDLTFTDIDLKVKTEFEVLKLIYTEWLFDPVEFLLNSRNPFFKISATSNLMMFFESFSHYKRNYGIPGNAGKFFKDEWKQFMNTQFPGRNLYTNQVWKMVRNGLFHSMNLGSDILIDFAGKLEDTPVGKIEYQGIENDVVNPKILLDSIKSYLDSELDRISHLPFNSSELMNFKNRYKERILNPLDAFKSQI